MTWLASCLGDRVLDPPPEPDGLELVNLKMADEGGSVRQRHRLLQHSGAVAYATLDRTDAASALGAFVADAIAVNGGGTWFRLPSVVHGDDIVLIDPMLSGLLERTLPRLRRSGVRAHPSPFLRLDTDTDTDADSGLVDADVRVHVAANPYTHPDGGQGEPEPLTPAGSYRVRGLIGVPAVVPAPGTEAAFSPADIVRLIAGHAVRADQAHLDAALALASRVPFRLLAFPVDDRDLTDAVHETFASSADKYP